MRYWMLGGLASATLIDPSRSHGWSFLESAVVTFGLSRSFRAELLGLEHLPMAKIVLSGAPSTSALPTFLRDLLDKDVRKLCAAYASICTAERLLFDASEGIATRFLPVHAAYTVAADNRALLEGMMGVESLEPSGFLSQSSIRLATAVAKDSIMLLYQLEEAELPKGYRPMQQAVGRLVEPAPTLRLDYRKTFDGGLQEWLFLVHCRMRLLAFPSHSMTLLLHSRWAQFAAAVSALPAKVLAEYCSEGHFWTLSVNGRTVVARRIAIRIVPYVQSDVFPHSDKLTHLVLVDAVSKRPVLTSPSSQPYVDIVIYVEGSKKLKSCALMYRRALDTYARVLNSIPSSQVIPQALWECTEGILEH